MDNLELWERVRAVPKEALKEICAGRLKGKSDINPVWRIKKLTEVFGRCGSGWYYDIDKQWLEAGANGEIAAFCNITLYYKDGDEWSKGIPATGGSAFVAQERSGFYTSDEAYKMALTDALSVACKALGFAADIYFNADRTKYTAAVDTTPAPVEDKLKTVVKCTRCGQVIKNGRTASGEHLTPEQVAQKTGGLCAACLKIKIQEEAAKTAPEEKPQTDDDGDLPF